MWIYGVELNPTFTTHPILYMTRVVQVVQVVYVQVVQVCGYMGVNPKIGVENHPKMDGENIGKPYFLIDDFGGTGTPIFGNTHYGVELNPTFPTPHPIL